MLRGFFVFAFMHFVLLSYCQLGLNAGTGAKGLAMGGSTVADQGSYSIFNNQAGMIDVENLSVVLDVQRRFSLADISAVSAGIIKNTKFGHFGLMVSNYGFDGYNDQKIGLAYARKLTDILSIAGQLNALQIRIKDFGSSTSISFEAGLDAQLTKELNLAAHISNPFTIEITDQTAIDTRFRIGLQYKPSKKVEIHSEIDKILDQETNFRAGIEYIVLEKLYLRLGYSFNPSTMTFGFGYKISNSLQLDGGYSFHQQLGYTPGISIVWNKSKQ